MSPSDAARLSRARRAHISALRDLAHAELIAGRLDESRQHAVASAKMAKEIHAQDQMAASLQLLGKISRAQGQPDRAEAELGAGLHAAIASQSYLIAAFCCEELSSIATEKGDYAQAEIMAQGAEDAFWRVPDYTEDDLPEVAEVTELTGSQRLVRAS